MQKVQQFDSSKRLSWPIFIWPSLSGESVRNWVSSALDVMEVEGVFQQSDLPPRQARGRGGAR